MIQQIRGKWSFLEDLGGLVGTYAKERENRKKRDRDIQLDQADALFKVAAAGALPDGLDGQAVTALQAAGVQPDALFRINKRTKEQQRVADERALLENQRTAQLIEQGKATAAYNTARANNLEEPKTPEVNIDAVTKAVRPYARHPKLGWAESLAQLRTLPQVQGVDQRVLQTVYESEVEAYREERAREARLRARGEASGGGRPMTPSTQLNYWQDLTTEALKAALGRLQLLQQPGELTPVQRSQVLSTAIDLVNRSDNPAIRAQFEQGLGLANFQASLTALEKQNRPSARGRATGAVGLQAKLDSLQGGGAAPAAGASAAPAAGASAAPARRPATVDDVRAAMAAVGEDEAKVRQWLISKGIQPPEG